MKKPISATINADLIRWLDEVLKKDNTYRNKSHMIEVALENFKFNFQEKEDKKKR